MNTKHTPGPWTIVGNNVYSDDTLIVEAQYRGSLPRRNWDNDAALIAAAPDLLAALRALAEEADRHASHPVSDHRPYFTTMAARARAAIAKVEGQS